MNKKERIQIFIDGGNFHHLALKKLNIKELNFSFKNFTNFLAGDREITEMGKRFYIGTVREKEGDKHSKMAMAEQTSLFSILKKENWQIKTSKLRDRLEKLIIDERTVDCEKILKKGIHCIEFNRQREKGIDVKIATDLIIGAMDDKYDTAVLVSSDTDLIPAIDIVIKRFKKKIEYIGFSIINKNNQNENIKPSRGLIQKTSFKKILEKSDILLFANS
ncbi:MAG TPA: NYN domain-containing protein [bacterium]|nr:NYN domain-containing protein [bacterium]HPT29664.1 NYN domain-containing protein [bacterium]